LWDATEVYRSVYYNDAHNREMVDSEHQALVAAVKAGDAATALTVLTVHREHAIEALRPALEQAGAGKAAKLS
jgi:DNA-binding GntR family transcriptional regulator